MKQFFRKILIASVLIVMMILPFCNYVYAAEDEGGSFGAGTLGMYLDDFMIKSQFHLDTKKYTLLKKSDIEKDGKKLMAYEFHRWGNGTIFVDVDKKTNQIVHFKYFSTMRGINNTILNSMYNAWLPAITGRYGEPTEEKGAELYMGEQVLAKYARFNEEGHYKYYFGGYRTPGPALNSSSGILIEVTAL